MGGSLPWEKPQAAAPPAGGQAAPAAPPGPSAPWAKYNATGTGVRESKGSSYPMTPPEPKVIQEMHPDIGIFERLAAENLATGPQAKVDYLRQQHPGMDIKLDPKSEGQILVRKSGEQDYRVLNPTVMGLSTEGTVPEQIGRGVKEGLLDIGGGAYDIGAGLASGAAATAGGAAGLVRGGIPGGVAGAVGAGGSTLAAMESLRQGLGQALGVNKEADLGQVVRAGEFGGAAPLAFGVPGVVKGALPAVAGAFRENVAPKIGSFFSGISEGAINSAKEHLGEFGDIAKRGVEKLGLGTMADAETKLRQHMAEAGSDIGAAVGHPDVKVDLTGAEKQLQDYVDRLRGLKGARATPEIQEKINSAQATLDHFFGGIPETKITVVGPGRRPGSEAAGSSSIVGPRVTGPSPVPNPYGLPVEADRQIAGSIEKGGDYVPSVGADPYGVGLHTTPADILTPGSTVSSTVTEKGPKIVPGDRAWDLQKALENAAKVYEEAPPGSRSVADKQLFRSMKGAAADIHDQLNAATGGAFDTANKRFENLTTIERNLRPFFGDTTGQKTYSKLSNIFSNANEPTLNNMREIDEVLGSNLEGTANLLQGYKQFNNPGLLPVSNGNTTSTTRSLLAGDAGQLAGEFVAPHAPLVQRAARTVAQATVGSPWVLKKQMQAGQGADWLKNYLGKAASPAATASAWTMLQGQGGNAP